MDSVQQLLDHKGTHVHTVAGTTSVFEATQQMNEYGIGALVVVRAGSVRGMFTERDVLRRVVAARLDPDRTNVSDVMTEDVMTCTPDTVLDDVRGMMMQRRVRHVPVVDKGSKLTGMVSIGDLNAWCLQKQNAEITYMEDYINGRV